MGKTTGTILLSLHGTEDHFYLQSMISHQFNTKYEVMPIFYHIFKGKMHYPEQWMEPKLNYRAILDKSHKALTPQKFFNVLVYKLFFIYSVMLVFNYIS